MPDMIKESHCQFTFCLLLRRQLALKIFYKEDPSSDWEDSQCFFSETHCHFDDLCHDGKVHLLTCPIQPVSMKLHHIVGY